jgi:hypothetical protein
MVGASLSGRLTCSVNPYIRPCEAGRSVCLQSVLSPTSLLRTRTYCWGDVKDLCNVRVNDYEVQLRGHVYAMLSNLYHKYQVTRLWLDMVCMYSYRTAMKHLRNLRFMPQFSEGFNSPQSGKIMYYICFELSFITSFVRERERGYFNLARDERRGNIERAMVEPDRA